MAHTAQSRLLQLRSNSISPSYSQTDGCRQSASIGDLLDGKKMNMRMQKKILGIVLSVAMLVAYAPFEVNAAYAEDEETQLSSEFLDKAEALDEDSPNQDENDSVNEESGTVLPDEEEAASNDDESVSVNELQNGTVEVKCEDGIVSGVAMPDAGYDLASIRILYGDNSEKYIDFEYKEGSNPAEGYTFSYDITELDSSELTIDATFFDTKVWDGAVDISWYDPEKSSYDISTPAQLAGVAVIVNGMIDPNETTEDQIKALRREDIDKYIQTEPWHVQLLEQQGGGVDDIAYRQPKARETGILGEDDLYNDMRYRTINITADIDMGTEKNYIPIGGKYAMIVKNDQNLKGDEVKVIDTRFQGIFDGHGHTITVNCNRFSSKGYGYTWNVGLIGYLGGGVDTIKNSAKDNKIEVYSNEGYAPAVRNLVLRGSIKGRRGTGGIVGRIGQTSGTVIVENCANYATVRGTDKVGCAGIVGAPWGKSIIRNCYNAGTVRCVESEIGGIVGSNGYGWGSNNVGANIYNCFNVGDVQNASIIKAGPGTPENDTDITYAGGEISYDGDAAAEYEIDNCYYIDPFTSSVRAQGVYLGNNSYAYVGNVEAVSAEEMNSRVLTQLNKNGNIFVKGSEHPLLYFEKEKKATSCTVSIASAENGTVSADGHSSAFTVPYGTTINLSNTGNSGYRLANYLANGEAVNNDFYTVTEDVTISGAFVERGTAILSIAKSSDYTIEVKRIQSSIDGLGKGETLSDGDTIYADDVLELSGKLKEGAAPPDVNYEYTGRFGKASAVDPDSAEAVPASQKQLKVTGNADVLVRLEPKTQLKDWATYADTSWYYGHESDTVYTLTNARELAGMAKILCDGVDEGGSDFAGKTIKLGNDIDLINPDENGGRRLWRTVGNNRDTFKGVFNGCGYTISNIYVSHAVPIVGNITGNHGGIFGFTDGATIKNLTIEGRFWATAGDTGVFAGKAKNTIIENCCNKVVLENCKETGAIVGDACGTTVIKNCDNKGTITGTHSLGGIVSKVSKLDTTLGESNDVRIENCYNYGNVDGTFCNNAGLVALCESKATVINCANYGDISSTMTSESKDPLCAVGGLSAVVTGALTIDSCVNAGSVTAEGYTIYAGGLVGYTTVNTPKLYNSYNAGEIISNSRYSEPYVSGLFNASSNRYPEVKNCYNRGNVNVGPRFSGNGYGGIAAVGTGTKISNSFCTRESVAAVGETAGIAGTVVDEDKLKTLTTTLGDAYNNDTDNINGGCPILLWQDPENKGHVHVYVLTKTVSAGNCKDGYKLYTCRCGLTKKTVLKGYSTSYVKGYKLVAGRKCFTAKWTKQSTSTQKKFSGYQIQYSLKSSYASAKTVSVKKSASYKKISKLSGGKKYYVRIRTYTKKNGKTYYSKWTSKTITTKR